MFKPDIIIRVLSALKEQEDSSKLIGTPFYTLR
jgi:hypothetical protein